MTMASGKFSAICLPMFIYVLLQDFVTSGPAIFSDKLGCEMFCRMIPKHKGSKEKMYPGDFNYIEKRNECYCYHSDGGSYDKYNDQGESKTGPGLTHGVIRVQMIMQEFDSQDRCDHFCKDISLKPGSRDPKYTGSSSYRSCMKVNMCCFCYLIPGKLSDKYREMDGTVKKFSRNDGKPLGETFIRYRDESIEALKAEHLQFELPVLDSSPSPMQLVQGQRRGQSNVRSTSQHSMYDEGSSIPNSNHHYSEDYSPESPMTYQEDISHDHTALDQTEHADPDESNLQVFPYKRKGGQLVRSQSHEHPALGQTEHADSDESNLPVVPYKRNGGQLVRSQSHEHPALGQTEHADSDESNLQVVPYKRKGGQLVRSQSHKHPALGQTEHADSDESNLQVVPYKRKGGQLVRSQSHDHLALGQSSEHADPDESKLQVVPYEKPGQLKRYEKPGELVRGQSHGDQNRLQLTRLQTSGPLVKSRHSSDLSSTSPDVDAETSEPTSNGKGHKSNGGAVVTSNKATLSREKTNTSPTSRHEIALKSFPQRPTDPTCNAYCIGMDFSRGVLQSPSACQCYHESDKEFSLYTDGEFRYSNVAPMKTPLRKRQKT